ncbi:MAG: response regulator, partial [Actinobacteria bacterium]
MPQQARTALNVLVVDDEPEIRELLVEYFRDRGFETATAGDGRAAIAAIERDPARYRLIVSDLQMPGADGLAVLRAARAANPSCYVVIVTGYASLDSAIQAVRLGAYDYLTKPFSMGQID